MSFRHLVRIIAAIALVGPACLCGPGGAEIGEPGQQGDGRLDGGLDAGSDPDAGHLGLDAGAVTDSGVEDPDAGVQEVPLIYAHSDSELYGVDPDTLAITRIGAFDWPAGFSGSMTDIAVDRDNKLIGISFNTVYTVDPATAQCTRLATLDRSFNGLSFIPASQDGGTGPELLVGAAVDGSFYRVNPQTGISTKVGQYGGGLSSSGDIVSVTGATFATVLKPGDSTDWLARIDPATGAATLVGDTGFSKIWGLGFWKDKVFGFNEGGQFLLIDVHTGKATLKQASSASWWGAGVTTKAVVTIN